MFPKKRYDSIDYLRGLCILVMILIHSNSYFLHDSVSSWIWDASQFAVVGFIFCSAFLYFMRPLRRDEMGLTYFKKRVSRLLVPYYLFFTFFSVLVSIVHPETITPQFLSGSYFLYGGIDINWLVLLFVQFAILFPLLNGLYHNKLRLFYLYSAVSFISSVLFLFITPPFDYRFIMVLPWSLIACFVPFYISLQKNRRLQILLFVSIFLVFSLSYGVLNLTHHSLIQFQNKYPPNLFHISYGLSIVIGLMIVFRSRFFEHLHPVVHVLKYLSTHSYTIYFIHYTMIYILTRFYDYSQYPFWAFFAVVFGYTLIIQFLLQGVLALTSKVFRIPARTS